LTTGPWSSAKSNPDVKRVATLVASTRGKLLDAVRSHVAALTARVSALDDLKMRSVANMQVLPQAGAEEARLLQRVETIRKMADELREEYQLARIEEAVEAGQVEIVDQAILPDEPISNGRNLKLLLALLFGLGLGGAAAFLTEHLNMSIRRNEEMEDGLQIPGLAIIPRLAMATTIGQRLTHKLPMPKFRNRRMARSATQLDGTGHGTTAGNGTELITVSDLRSAGSEAFRTLRTNLLFSQAVQSVRTIIVTSAGPSEGKTVTVANLAVTFAQQGLKVLIIDCDLRKPRQQSIFGIKREPGLTQVILGFNSAAEAIQPTTVDGLFVLPAGTLPPNPTDLLGGDRMRALLTELKDEFNLIILDTSPLLVAADAAALGTYSDGMLLVVRAGKTDKRAAQRVVQQLRTVGVRILGGVLNDPDAKVPHYGGYYYYYASYYGAEA
jgi:capsular exopolysaccharide synthesis family protein